MDKTQRFLVESLELHLFFARIMKEHAFFLAAGFLPPQKTSAGEAERFLRRWESVLSRAIELSNQVVRCCVLTSGEVVTEFTDKAEAQSQRLTGIPLNRRLTERTQCLSCWDGKADWHPTSEQFHKVCRLNRDALALVQSFIRFKEQLLHDVQSCTVFTVNYPLLIAHILREARLYCGYLLRLDHGEDRDCKEMRDSELFWNRIMMEHALFIRGLLDPSEEALIAAADTFAEEYHHLLEASGAAHDKMLRSGGALALTKKFRDFKCDGVKGIEACRISSVMLPLLADHVLREANHYLRLLGTGNDR